jgi:hypothetical protein
MLRINLTSLVTFSRTIALLEGSMNWIGKWRNQYGSTLEITDDFSCHLTGTFSTALDDSGFYGRAALIVGVHQGVCISFAFASATPSGDSICAFAGMLIEGKLQTVWHVVTDKSESGTEPGERAWAHSVLSNADMFTRTS